MISFIVVILCLLILWLFYSILDEKLATHGCFKTAIVIQRDFTPESNSTGIGPAIGGGGGVAFTNSHEDEKWVLIVKFPNGDIEPIETDKEKWCKYDKGDEIKIEYKIGRFSKEEILGEII